jgi:hypothetical protein
MFFKHDEPIFRSSESPAILFVRHCQAVSLYAVDDNRVYWVRLRLRTATNNRLIVYPQVICEHGNPEWNYIDRRKIVIRPPAVSGNPSNKVI